MTVVEGWWGDYGPTPHTEGATPKGQKQAPVKPAADATQDKASLTKPVTIKTPKVKFGPRK